VIGSRAVTTKVMVAVVMLSPCARAQAQPARESVFITARGDRLYEGDEKFRFLSFNVPNLHYVEDDMRFAQAMPFRWPDEYEIGDALESIRQIGGQVARTYTLSVRKTDDPAGMPRHVLGPGQFDEKGFRALDAVLDLAHRNGVRLIIPLVDNWSWWGGVGEYAAFRGKGREAFWSDPQLIADFKESVRFVLTRVNTRTGVSYRDDPTILAWETGNELECPHEWTRQVAAYVKGLDRNHLVLDGRRAEILDRESIENPYIDLLQTHHYESGPREMIAHIRRSAALARGRKPYHVGEFGFLTTAGMTAVMDAIVEEGLAGGLVWSLRSHDRDGGFYWHSEPHGGDLFKAYHWPGFASGEAYDEARFMREMRRRAFVIRGVREPDRETPAPPRVIEVTAGGLVTWRGSTGANEYDVQRKGSQGDAWRTIVHGVSDAAVQYRPLFCDETVTPGLQYWYRVVARNEAGASAPSEAFGPVTVEHRTLVDEVSSDARIFVKEGRLEFRSDGARRFKEDAHGFEGEVDAAAIYRTDGPQAGGRVYAFAERATDHLGFAVSRNGTEFQSFEPLVQMLAVGDAATYGYWLPVVYRLDGLPKGTRFLRIGLRRGIRVTRVELDHGEERAMDAAALRHAIEGELRSNLLPFWREKSLDHVRGGFIAEMTNDGTVRGDAAKGLVLNARLVWTFAALYRQLGDTRDLELARRAYEYLEAKFRDREHGGYVWRVDPEGRAVDRSKKVYGQAFCIYALSEYYLATKESGALEAARQVYGLIERHARDQRYGGYIESRAPDWSATTELRLSDGDMNAPKSMNTHLHLLEAYTNLFRAWPDASLAARLRELVNVFGRHILERGGGPGSGHLRHFFDERWEVLSDTYTYGHDIEASWLLSEAAEALGDQRLAAEVRRWGVEIAGRVLGEALGADGGLAYEGRGGTVIDTRRDWWCQAEAVVGFWNAYSLTSEARFSEAAARVWEFIAGRVVDRVNGDWFWRVRADGSVDRELPKVSEWKCPYHSVRMCLEMMRRLANAADGVGK
jgi:mannose/cellobiose epimerase-like protein (N-acyl-D-glucosamine 2-epimerase family)